MLSVILKAGFSVRWFEVLKNTAQRVSLPREALRILYLKLFLFHNVVFEPAGSHQENVEYFNYI